MLSVRKLRPEELPLLTALFDYNDVEEMLRENEWKIRKRFCDIFGLFLDGRLVGELRVAYEIDTQEAMDLDFVQKGIRVYLYAFRVHRACQDRGLGTYLLEQVLKTLRDQGYSEFTVGVEDDNGRAKHMYASFGFAEVVGRKQESYQGDSYEFDLLLCR